MSLTPDNSLASANLPPADPGRSHGSERRRSSALGLLGLALFTFAVGLFLMLFPWSDAWNLNYFQQGFPGLQDLWDQDSFRGAFTGLGLVNIYISCLQIARLFRRG